MNTFIDAALRYAACGLSVIPIREDKNPGFRWTPFQRQPMGTLDITKRFSAVDVQGIAVVCGEVSGNLEVIDIDMKYDLTGDLFDRFIQKVTQFLPPLASILPIAMTRNNGFHIFYRARIIGRNTQLAKRPATDEELAIDPLNPSRVVIETVAEGGIALLEPSPGYVFYQGSLNRIPVISHGERSILMAIARSFNTYEPPEEKVAMPYIYPNNTDMPFAAYDQSPDRRENVLDLLEKHGWTIGKAKGLKTFVTRPGHTTHGTSGDYHHVLNLLTIFSTNSVFTPQKGYKPHAVFAILECNGDFRLAAKRLLAQGYGRPRWAILN